MLWYVCDMEEACALRYRKAPDGTVQRLPSYLRAIRSVSEKGRTCTCSEGLAEILHTSPPQIRKDLSYFGSFGSPGKGYEVEEPARRLSGILRLDRTHKAALVGIGNLGIVLLKYAGFALYRFEIVAALDVDPKKIGRPELRSPMPFRLRLQPVPGGISALTFGLWAFGVVTCLLSYAAVQ
jgi:NADH/NAD ratio-sensing transcriptional regulator Rex